MEVKTNIASEESKWLIRNHFQVISHYKALADSRNLEIEEMVNALEETRANWLADRKQLQSDKKELQAKISTLREEVARSSEALKESMNQRHTAELNEIKRQLKEAVDENKRLKERNDRLKLEHVELSSTAVDTPDQRTDASAGILIQLDDNDNDESFHSPMTTPNQAHIPMRTERKKRRSSAAFVRRSSSLPARSEAARSGSSDGGEDDGEDCYHTSIKRIKCSQNLHHPEMHDTINDRCFSVMSTSGTPARNVSYDNRPHVFGKRRNFYRINCNVCGVCIGFSSMSVKCSRCKCVLHEHCRLKASPPCLTWIVPPKAADGMRLRLGDFCPNERPMVPPLIAYCVYYLDDGLSPNDLYENAGSKFELEAIEKMFKAPTNNIKLDTFSKVSVAAIIKKFLGEIRDPLIPSSYAQEFVQAAVTGSLNAFPKLINDLPTAHMDALACLCRHWRLYVESGVYSHFTVDAFCGRIASTVFGVRAGLRPVVPPTSANHHNYASAVINKDTAFCVLKNLLEFPAEFWTELLNSNQSSADSSRSQTPILRNPSGRSTNSMKTTSSCNSHYPNVDFEKADDGVPSKV